MQVVTFLYNIFLIILYSIVLSYAAFLYVKKRSPVFLILAALYLFYVFDNTIIYMTEFIDSFSFQYDLQFMNVPAFKTVIFVASAVCMTKIQQCFLPGRDSRGDVPGLVLYSLALLFTPLLGDNAFMVWLYYLPNQVYLFYLGLSGYLFLRKRPLLQEKKPFLIHYKKMALFTAFFMILILVEDTIVIFSIDIYSDIMVRINNRSFSEDAWSILLSLFAIRHLSSAMWGLSVQGQEPPLETLEAVEDVLQKTETDQTIKLSQVMEMARIVESPKTMESPRALEEHRRQELDSAFYPFVTEFQLTVREQDILRVLLGDKNNQEISEELFISVGTVKTHVHNIFQKVDVTKRSQLLRQYDAYRGEYLRRTGWNK